MYCIKLLSTLIMSTSVDKNKTFHFTVTERIVQPSDFPRLSLGFSKITRYKARRSPEEHPRIRIREKFTENSVLQSAAQRFPESRLSWVFSAAVIQSIAREFVYGAGRENNQRDQTDGRRDARVPRSETTVARQPFLQKCRRTSVSDQG